MNERIERVVKSVKTTWESQDRKHRIVYIGLAAAILVIIIAAIIITANLNKKEYITIYQNLETTEASEMVSLIQDMNYDVRLINGTDIAVVRGTENDIVMQLTLQNYPKSGKNYALSTESGMFDTEAENELSYQIDTQNRLEAQLREMENIAAADVNISIPKHKNTVISSIREYPTASVKLTLDGIEKLSNKQITGIKNLVKMTVTGLTDENVEIVDNYGIPQMINLEADYDQVLQETKKFAFKTQLENSIRDKILGGLIPSYGEDGAYVMVNIGLVNSDKQVSETVDYSGDSNNGGAGVLSHADGSNASGGTTVAGGVVGVEGNADDTYPTGDTDGNNGWSEDSFSNTYLVDTFKEQVERDGYRIEDLSVSVIVYTDYLAETTRLSLIDAAGKAASIRPAFYDDLVSVINLPKYIDPLELESTEPTYLFGLTFNQLVLVGAILLILLIALFVTLAILSGNAKKQRKEFEKQIIETSGLVGIDGEEPVDMFILTDPETGVEVPSLTDEQIETKEVVIRREITEFANHSPEIVAQLLKSWIKSEEE
ncbi:MAG: hypothetical protein K2J76_08420 [Oscillospiraceae bacterium]|nr:hypothetical protein [Oscillospiraceae bacterium]